MAANLAMTFPEEALTSSSVIGRLKHEQSIVGTSDAFKAVMHRVDQVAATNATVLLLGETGTGKELIARAIHQRSSRRHRSFVVVDCGALAATLIESELFGRERGAFTGAFTSQAGRFELASGGTIFLDEIGDLPLELQPKLLRVLQEGEIERLGSARTTRVDVRIVAATNRNLIDDVQCGRFRRDLFYRLNVFPIALPALRHRREDLPALVGHFCDRLSRQLDIPFGQVAPGALEALERHDWPGNIRELENVIQRAIVVAQGGPLDLAGAVGMSVPTADPPRVTGAWRSLLEVERDYIGQVLENARWRIEGVSGAAQILGLRPSTLRARMNKLGIRRPS
jgi:transcriptional regulator with GAF, ATPase, and Fis domain